MEKKNLQRAKISVLAFGSIYFLTFGLFACTSLRQMEYRTMLLATLSFVSMILLIYFYRCTLDVRGSALCYLSR